MTEILTASAGSGKTFRLAKTYIRLLFSSDEPFAYRHILAVTFTNKATAEMKSRILKELDILARNPLESDYHDDLLPFCGDDVTMKSKAEGILFNLLHDYSAFSVSTIDRFFQMTLKAFAREMGRFSDYQVELDGDSLVEESVDRILDSMTEKDSDLIGWLSSSAREKLEESGSVRLDTELKTMAKNLRSEDYRALVGKSGVDESVLLSTERLDKVRKACLEYEESFLTEIKSEAQTIIDKFKTAEVELSETNRRFAEVLWKFVDGSADFKKEPSAAFREKAADPNLWFAKAKAKLRDRLLKVDHEIFVPFLELAGQPMRLYNTSVILRRQLYNLGIASVFGKEFSALAKEKNVMDIRDSNVLLGQIIGDCDAPFIYEKLGVRFGHFLLDEFQDTSVLQWNNFLPLLKESQGNGNDNLIVGDVKQSIYRWRGSDWRLLSQHVRKDLDLPGENETMTDNWRSRWHVVDFNNKFFPYAALVLDGGEKGTISGIYDSCSQNVRKGVEGEGLVRFSFCPRDKELDEILLSVHDAVNNGKAAYSSIAVIVRNNKEGKAAARFLIGNGIPVISDESLMVKSSPLVRDMVNLMRYADDPHNQVNEFAVSLLSVEIPDHWRSLADLAESLLSALLKNRKDVLDGNEAYVMAFMDFIQEWTSRNGNVLRDFLKAWDEKDISISCPESIDAVRILTVHKSKGLEYDYVVIPFAETICDIKADSKWCCPELKVSALEAASGMPFYVKLDSSADGTVFTDEYGESVLMKKVDNLNILYVALTRAKKAFHLIADQNGKGAVLARILYGYVKKNCRPVYVGDDDLDPAIERFFLGSMPLLGPASAEDASVIRIKPDCVPVKIRGRLKLNRDSLDFFTGDDSKRHKGIILHDILAGIVLPSDVDKAVQNHLDAGLIDSFQAKEYSDLLHQRVAEAVLRGWFPDDASKVRNERDIVGTDGEAHRPDRVVTDGDKAIIIDYKSGAEDPGYLEQVRLYATLYRSMGFKEVQACLWYVYENKIVYL